MRHQPLLVINAKFIFKHKQFYFKQFSLAYKDNFISGNSFRTSTQFSSIWPVDRTLSTSGHSGPGWNGNEGVLSILQSSSITGASSSDYLVSYPERSFGESYPSAKMQSVFSAAPADWESLKLDFKAMFQVIDANLSSTTWRVSGKLGISQSSEACHLHDLGKCIQIC